MHYINRQALVNHDAKKMFTLVNDIEAYPGFLKWCHHSHVIEKSSSLMVAGMTVALVGIKQKFTTHNRLTNEKGNFKIDLSLIKGPFKKLSGYWLFTQLGANASKVELYLEFDFKSGILNSAFKNAFGIIARQLISDFIKRAKHVYS